MLARALYDNAADFADELSFRRGDTLVVIERELSGAPGWWLCSLGGRQGIVPANRLQLIAVRDPDDNNNNTAINNKAASGSVVKNRGYFYKPLGDDSSSASAQHRQQQFQQQQQQQACYLISPVSSSFSPASSNNNNNNNLAPPAYTERSCDPSPALLSSSSDINEQAENIYENFTSGEGENLYEDPTLWVNPPKNNSTATPGDSTPTMFKQSRQSYTVRTVATGLPSTTTNNNTSTPNRGLLVTTTAHHRVNQSSTPGTNTVLDPSGTYQASSTDSGVYSRGGDYAEDIYDYPAAFQQIQVKYAPNSPSSTQQDGIYDLVPGGLVNEAQTTMGDYDFLQMSPVVRPATLSPQLGDYDPLPNRIEIMSISDSTALRSNQPQVPIGEQQAPSESMETLPEFSQAECEKAFESRRNVIERLVRYEHAVTRAASRWSRLFGSSGWRKSGFLVANAYSIRSSGEQLAHTMTTFAAFAAAALSRLDFPTFSTVSNLRNAYEPLYIEATNFKKYLISVGLVNWTLENAAPHLTKTLEAMLHSQRTFLTNLALFSNILKRADFTTITGTTGSTHNLAGESSSQQENNGTLNKQQQHRTFMVVRDVQTPTSSNSNIVSSTSQHNNNQILDEAPPTPRQAHRGVSSVHINIPASAESSMNAKLSTSTVTSANNNNRHQPGPGHQKSLRFAEDVELVAQLAGDLEQRIGEMSFVVSTFVLSLRRTQPSAYKPDLPDGQRYNGGFIECGKLLVNVAHSVVLIGDKLSSIVTELERSESIKASTDRLRVCIRVFVEKLKNVASAGSRSAFAVDDLITHVEVLRSQAEAIKHRLGASSSPTTATPTDLSYHHHHQSLSTPTATLNR